MSTTLTTQAEALLDAAGLSPAEKVVKSPVMTPHERLQALQLYEAGETFISIGEKLGRDRQTIARNLEGFTDSSELARKWLSGKALDLAQAWTEAAQKAASKGFHTPAKEALLHAKVIEPLAESPKTGIVIHVGNGAHSTSDPIATSLPTIIVQPVDPKALTEK